MEVENKGLSRSGGIWEEPYYGNWSRGKLYRAASMHPPKQWLIYLSISFLTWDMTVCSSSQQKRLKHLTAQSIVMADIDQSLERRTSQQSFLWFRILLVHLQLFIITAIFCKITKKYYLHYYIILNTIIYYLYHFRFKINISVQSCTKIGAYCAILATVWHVCQQPINDTCPVVWQLAIYYIKLGMGHASLL